VRICITGENITIGIVVGGMICMDQMEIRLLLISRLQLWTVNEGSTASKLVYEVFLYHHNHQDLSARRGLSVTPPPTKAWPVGVPLVVTSAPARSRKTDHTYNTLAKSLDIIRVCRN
jgi:hypothetical protein